MVRQHDTTGQVRPEDAAPRLVLELGQDLPAAEAAERVVEVWRQSWRRRPVTMVVVPVRRFSAFVEHLRRRLMAHPALSRPFPGFRERIRLGLDDGGTLVAGGRTLADGALEPTLFLNLDPAARLLQATEPAGPLLAVLRHSDAARAESGVAQDVQRLSPDPQPNK